MTENTGEKCIFTIWSMSILMFDVIKMKVMKYLFCILLIFVDDFCLSFHISCISMTLENIIRYQYWKSLNTKLILVTNNSKCMKVYNMIKRLSSFSNFIVQYKFMPYSKSGGVFTICCEYIFKNSLDQQRVQESVWDFICIQKSTGPFWINF